MTTTFPIPLSYTSRERYRYAWLSIQTECLLTFGKAGVCTNAWMLLGSKGAVTGNTKRAMIQQ